MSIQVGCEGCGKIYTVDDRFAGKKAKCKTCGAVMTVPAAKPAAAARSASASSSAGRRSSSSPSSSGSQQRASSTASARPVAHKPVAVEAKPDPGDIDLSALDAIENSGEVDHDYVAAMPVAAPRKDAAAAAARPKGTVYRPTSGVTKVGGRQVAAPANVPATFWESLKPGPAGYVFLGVLVIGALCIASAKASAYAALGFGVVGIIFIILSKIMVSSMARQEGSTTYLMYRFVPFYAFYYFISRWQDTQKATSTWLKGAAMFLLALGLMVRSGDEFEGALGAFYKPGHTQTAANSGRNNGSNSKTTSKEDDPDHDDLDDNPDLTLPQKIAIRHARQRQKDIEAMGLRVVEPLKVPARTEFPPLPDKGIAGDLADYTVKLEGDFLASPMSMKLWMPDGDHPPRSLPCIFMPPMDSPLLEGCVLHERDMRAQLMAKHGFAVVAYDDSRWSDNIRPQFPGAVEEELMQSDCGVHFAHDAINFVLHSAPMVDPERLYAAGEGGAGRLVLYLAAVDPRIKAVATVEPVCDVTKHNMGMSLAELAKQTRLAGIDDFAKKTSPINNLEALKCPILVVTRSGSQPPTTAAAAAQDSEDSSMGFERGGEDVGAFIAGMKKLGRPITVQPPVIPKDRGAEPQLEATFEQWAKWFKSLPKTTTPTTTATTRPTAG